jgi:hypothetical protein
MNGYSKRQLEKAIRAFCWRCCGESMRSYCNCGGSVNQCGEIFKIKEDLRVSQLNIFTATKNEFFQKATEIILEIFPDGFWWSDVRAALEKNIGSVPGNWYGALAQKLIQEAHYCKMDNNHKSSDQPNRNGAHQFYYIKSIDVAKYLRD